MPETCPLTDREIDAHVAEHVMGQKVKPGWAMMCPPEGWLVCDAPQDSDDEWGVSKHPIQLNGRRWEVVEFYSTDLNVCAQAEAKIRELNLILPWAQSLLDITSGPGEGDTFALTWREAALLMTANARQRSSAMWLIREQIEAAKSAGKVTG